MEKLSKEICKDCFKFKVHSYSRLNAQGRHINVDERGHRWVGRSCPDCWRSASRKHQRTRRGTCLAYEAPCKKCGDMFLKKGNRKHCGKCRRYTTHSHKSEDTESKRKLRENRRMLNVAFAEIKNLYENVPEGYVIAHAIPLHHPDICGLHVPWNIIFITSNELKLKADSFDGTYENESWKINKVLTPPSKSP